MVDADLTRELTLILLGGRVGFALYLCAAVVMGGLIYLAPYFGMRRVLRGRERLRRGLRWPTFVMCLAAAGWATGFYVEVVRAHAEHMLAAAREDRIIVSADSGGFSYAVEVSEKVGAERRPLVWFYRASDLAELQSVFARARASAPASR